MRTDTERLNWLESVADACFTHWVVEMDGSIFGQIQQCYEDCEEGSVGDTLREAIDAAMDEPPA